MDGRLRGAARHADLVAVAADRRADAIREVSGIEEALVAHRGDRIDALRQGTRGTRGHRDGGDGAYDLPLRPGPKVSWLQACSPTQHPCAGAV